MAEADRMSDLADLLSVISTGQSGNSKAIKSLYATLKKPVAT